MENCHGYLFKTILCCGMYAVMWLLCEYSMYFQYISYNLQYVIVNYI